LLPILLVLIGSLKPTKSTHFRFAPIRLFTQIQQAFLSFATQD